MFRWLRPRIEMRGEIMMPPPPPVEIHISMEQPPPEEEPPQDQIEYGPLRLVKEGDDA